MKALINPIAHACRSKPSTLCKAISLLSISGLLSVSAQAAEFDPMCQQNMSGGLHIQDPICEANWAATVGVGLSGIENHTHKDDGCQTEGEFAGKRKYSSRLWNIKDMSWEEACSRKPMIIAGKIFSSPDKCVNKGFASGMWGEWYVADSRCETTPPTIQRGANDSLKHNAPLSGYVDMHTHLMSNLGFGGTIFHGSPFGQIAEALQNCPSGHDDAHGEGHSRVEAILLDDILGAATGNATHTTDAITFWPSHNSFTHQTMYYDWIKRAYEGGMRSMVVLAVNGDYMFGAKDNGLPSAIRGIAIAENPIYSLNDMETLRRQTAAVYEMEAWVDQKYGGAGKGWFRIVTSPQQARSVIEEGKLAVILGSEVDYLLDCNTEETCSEDKIEAGVNAIYELGLRYAFPIHLKSNGFGGAAIYNILAYGDTYDCKHYSQDCNEKGMTEYGKSLMKALMKKGMIIDVGHMSALSLNDALTFAEEHAYPGIVTGHSGVYDMANGANRHEANPTGNSLKRIVDLGGMIGLIPGQGNLDQVAEWRNDGDTFVPNACGGSTQTFAQSYLYLKDLVGDAAYSGSITVGTDFNGFAHMPGPRFGDHACSGGKGNITQPASSKVSYPFTPDPALLAPANSQNGISYDAPYVFGTRTFDFNTDGAAHIGLMPEFFEDLRQQGLKRSDLEPIYRSADYLTKMWQNAVILGRTLTSSPP